MNSREHIRKYFTRLSDLFVLIDVDAISAFIDVLADTRLRGGTVFLAGNGGSAATCSHFANDLIKACGSGSGSTRPFKAVSLADNVALMTALANDDGFDTVFTGQMRNLFAAGDLLIAISASGNSPNVVAAAKLAHELQGRVAALVGFDGGTLKTIADVVVHVPTQKGEYGPVEDVHMILDHLVTSFLALRDRQ